MGGARIRLLDPRSFVEGGAYTLQARTGKPHDHGDGGHEEVYPVVDELTVRVGGTDSDPAATLVPPAGETLRVGAGTRDIF